MYCVMWEQIDINLKLQTTKKNDGEQRRNVVKPCIRQNKNVHPNYRELFWWSLVATCEDTTCL